MSPKNWLISVLLIIFTSNSAAQYGSELGGDTLQESFVNFMQTITMVEITSVATAFLFLTVVALFYFASLNIFEQVFLRLEEIIKEALGEDARSLYRDNDHYPTGVKGMALAVAFISANGITGLVGLLTGIAMGLIGVAIPLVVHGKLMRIVGNTKIGEDGDLIHDSGSPSRGRRTRRTRNPSGSANLNGDPTMDPQKVVNIVQIIEDAEREIEEVENIEEEDFKEAERAKDNLEEEIANMEEKLDEDVTEKIKEVLRYKNKSDSKISKYLEDPEANKHEIRRINFSGRGELKEKRTISKNVSKSLDHLENRAESLEMKVSENEFGADYEALNKLEKIKIENHEIFEDYKAAIQQIKNEANVSDDINKILKEITKPKNLKNAGYTDMEDRRRIDDLIKDFKEQKEKMESIEGSVDKVNKILNDEDLPELDKIRRKTESRKKIVGYLLNEDEEADLSKNQIERIKKILSNGDSLIGKIEDKEKDELEELRNDHKKVHQGLKDVEEELNNKIDPEIRSILQQHGVSSSNIDKFLKNPKQLKKANISKDPDVIQEEDMLIQELKELFDEMEREKEVDSRDYSEIQNLVKKNHSILNGLQKMKKDIENTSSSGKDFKTTLKDFTEKTNWSAAGLSYDKNAADLAERMIEDVEEVKELESIAEELQNAFENEKKEIEAIESKLESRHNLMEYLADKDQQGGAGTGNNNNSD